MKTTSAAFKANAAEALADVNLQKALQNTRSGFIDKRILAIDRLPEFDRLRDDGRDIKNHTLAHLDLYLERFEEKVIAQGGHVHWAETAEDAREIIAGIAKAANAKTVTKGKSMITEEIALNPHLQAAGIEVVETDLGEYIVQIRGEAPSHIIAPAVHVTKEQIEADFRAHHTDLPADRRLEEPESLVAEARKVLRQRYLDAEVGITGANFLIAETGTSVIVTNEGNGDLTQVLAPVHIVVASLEKIVPTLEDVSTILRVLARSATGQDISTYTTFSTGPRRPGDPDGPQAYHVVLLDNGRANMLGGPLQDALRCIRCGACMNHCPVYQTVGGHAYGWVYPGPIGSVIDPALIGLKETRHLPNASTFCGRCEDVCPMRIPLPKMLRYWREQDFQRRLQPAGQRWGIRAWAWIARRPRIYRALTGAAMPVLGWLGGKKGRLATGPLAGGWTRARDLPAPQGATFHAQWKAREKRRTQ